MNIYQIRIQAINNFMLYAQKLCTKTDPLSKIWAFGIFNLSTEESSLSRSAFKAMNKTIKTDVNNYPETVNVLAAII
ncbi:MAG: hypothetical protein HQL71_03240 [Magnetococcales bacterium]|nr:hypothetical protein [Magnetococcales bacterium]